MSLYNTILVSFLSEGCINEVDNNWANYQWYECDVSFIQCHILTVTLAINDEGVW